MENSSAQPLDKQRRDSEKRDIILAQISSGDYSLALATIDREIQLFPKDPELVHLKGRCLQLSNDFSGALNQYSNALRLDPLHRVNIAAICRLLTSMGSPSESVELLQAYCQRIPEDFEMLHLLVMAQQAMIKDLQSGEMSERARTVDIIIRRLSNTLKAALGGKRLKIDTVFNTAFGPLACDLFALPRLRRAGIIDKELFFVGKAKNQQLIDMLAREVNIVQDASVPASIPSYYDWEAGRLAIDSKAFLTALFSSDFAKYFEDIFEFHCSTHGRTYCSPERYKEALAQQFTPRFTKEEEERGARLLTELFGVKSGDPFVCLLGRDVGYHNETPSSGSYFRNAPINNCEQAFLALANRGITVIRIGSSAKEPLKAKHPKVFDYATSGHNEFLDIYLIAKCKAYIAVPSGPIHVAELFNTPTLSIESVNICNAPSGQIFIPKKIISCSTGEYLTHGEVMRLLYGGEHLGKFWENGQLQESALGIKYENCTSEELTDGFLEMMERLEGRFIETDEDRALLARYEALVEPYRTKFTTAKIATTYLRRNSRIIFGN